MKQREKGIKKKKKNSFKKLWDNFKHANSHVIRHPQRKKERIEKIFEEIMAENFPKLLKIMNMKI